MSIKKEYDALHDLLDTVEYDILGHEIVERFLRLQRLLPPKYNFVNDSDTGIYWFPTSGGTITVAVGGTGGFV